MGRKASDIVAIAWAVADGNYGDTAYRCGDTWEYNVGLWTGWCWSWDCLGFVHTMVNGFNGNRNVLGGGAVMDDFVLNSDEATTLYNYCSNRGTFPYSGELRPGTLLEIHNAYGHVGMYTGMINGYQNMVECTGGGVRHAYIDSNGDVWNDCSRTYFYEHFDNWGEFDRVDYGSTPQPQPTPTPTKNKPIYRVYDDVSKLWLSEVYGDSDFAGIYTHDVDCVAIDGGIEYCVHCWGGDDTEHYDFSGWLDIVKGYDTSDYENGFAGNYCPIDALAIKTPGYKYKIHYRKSGQWEEPVSSDNYNLNDSESGYAGTIGEPIDAICIWKER